MSDLIENCCAGLWQHKLKYTCLTLFVAYFLYRYYKNRELKLLGSSFQCLSNKVVLITGASSGLGEALAKQLYKHGCRLILCSRTVHNLQTVQNEIIGDCLPTDDRSRIEPIVLQLDLSDIDNIETIAQKAIQYYGHIDVLINNGGVSYRGCILETDITVDQRIMRVNYFGQIALTKAILPSMLQRNSGKIVMISSVQGRIAIPHRSAYAASKHALHAFSDILRAELVDTGIAVCVITPGYLNTNLSINALTASGTKYGIVDKTTESGLDPKDAAQRIINSFINNENEVLLSSLLPKIAIIIRAIWPNIYFFMMRKRAKKLK